MNSSAKRRPSALSTRYSASNTAVAGDFLKVRSLGEVDFHRLRRAFDHRMAKIDGERQFVAFIGLESRPLIAPAHLDAARDAQEALGRGLLDDAGLLDEQHEWRCAAVHDWKLRSVEVDVEVVDAQAAERRHQVLDGVDLGAIAHETRGKARLADKVRARRNVDGCSEIDAPKDHAGIRGRRPQGDPDLLSGMQADACSRDELF